jgi:hypothetical protein
VPDSSEQAEPDGVETGALSTSLSDLPSLPIPRSGSQRTSASPGSLPGVAPATASRHAGPIEIEPVEGGLTKLLKEFED